MTKTFSKTTIDILRHGECEGGNIFRGSIDVPLSDTGLDSMKNSCAKANCKWDIIISSPLLRCRDFSKQLSHEMNIPFETDDRLREMSFGDWDGKDVDAIFREYEEHVRLWAKNPTAYTPPNAESIRQLNERIDEFRLDIQERYSGKHILLVTHGGVLRVLLAQVQGTPLENINNIEVPYACLSRYAVYDFNKKFRSDAQPDTEKSIEMMTKLVSHNFV
jgi:alpha-ribazole phosphatase